MIDWTSPFSRPVGVLLFVGLICFGVLIGLSLGFFSRELRIGDGWPPILAAIFAAIFGACVAFYLDDRKHRRELQEPVNKVRIILYQFERALSRLENSVKWDALRAHNGRRPAFTGVRNTMKNVAELTEKIPTDLIALPHVAIVRVRHARDRLWSGIEVDITYYVDKLEEDAKREDTDFGPVFDDDIQISWDDIKETLCSLRTELNAIETYLAKLL
jgi:hypothetical protein